MTHSIGSSDVASILGLGPWARPWQTWARLVGLVPRYDHADTPAQARGRMLEGAIGARYAAELQIAHIPGPRLDAGPVTRDEWMHARPDFWAGPWGAPASECWLLECKTLRRFDGSWGPAGTAEVVPHYLVQTVWQMAVCDVDRCDLAAFAMHTDEWRVYRIDRSAEVEALIVEDVRLWYERHVLGATPPTVDDTPECGRLLARMSAAPARKVTADAADTEREIIAELAELQPELDALDKRRRLLRNTLSARMGEREIYRLRSPDGTAIYTDGARRSLRVTWRAA